MCVVCRWWSRFQSRGPAASVRLKSGAPKGALGCNCIWRRGIVVAQFSLQQCNRGPTHAKPTSDISLESSSNANVPYPRKTDTTFCYFISCSYFWRERPVVANLNPHFVIIIMSTFPGLPGRIGAKVEYRPADIFVAPPGAATRNLKVAHLHSEHRGRIAGPY